MKIHLDCTWNESKDSGKITIHFGFKPKSLFCVEESEIRLMHSLMENLESKKPSALRAVKDLADKHKKSIYLNVSYYNALKEFERFSTAKNLLDQMEKDFPGQLFTKCLMGESFLMEENYEEFFALFNGKEVLKTAFPKRKSYFFEEAMCFHNLWGYYFFKKGNQDQASKHQKLLTFLHQTASTFFQHNQPIKT